MHLDQDPLWGRWMSRLLELALREAEEHQKEVEVAVRRAAVLQVVEVEAAVSQAQVRSAEQRGQVLLDQFVH